MSTDFKPTHRVLVDIDHASYPSLRHHERLLKKGAPIEHLGFEWYSFNEAVCAFITAVGRRLVIKKNDVEEL